MARILLLDDEQSIRRAIELHLTRQGHQVVTGSDGRDGLEHLKRDRFDLVITDLRMPRLGGMELLKAMREQGNQAPVIVLTAYTSVESAVEAMRLGASDYVGKPPQLDEITMKVNNLLSREALVEENQQLKRALEGRFQLAGIVGNSEAIQLVIEQVKLLARDPDIGILLTGESGTGKELIARTIHHSSPRRGGPFVAINCGALPEALLESELFGHEKGAFTGAGKEKKGLFEVAHRGTLFLDEVSAMPPAMQVKLLRALEEKELRRVGGTRNIQVDIRIVSASNRDLDQMVESDGFRRDLYYRLAVATIWLPPLRDRAGDVALLAAHFLEKYNLEKARSVTLHPRVIEMLETHSWPGNVRELQHLVELLVVTVGSGEITETFLPPKLRNVSPVYVAAVTPDLGENLKEATRELVSRFEREFILRQLEKHRWNVTRTAQAIGLSRAATHAKMKTYGIRERAENS